MSRHPFDAHTAQSVQPQGLTSGRKADEKKNLHPQIKLLATLMPCVLFAGRNIQHLWVLNGYQKNCLVLRAPIANSLDFLDLELELFICSIQHAFKTYL